MKTNDEMIKFFKYVLEEIYKHEYTMTFLCNEYKIYFKVNAVPEWFFKDIFEYGVKENTFNNISGFEDAYRLSCSLFENDSQRIKYLEYKIKQLEATK
jgi:hypothetical protein